MKKNKKKWHREREHEDRVRDRMMASIKKEIFGYAINYEDHKNRL